MKNIYFGIVAAGLALLASSCGKSSSSVAPIVTSQSVGPIFYPSNNSEYADFLGEGVLQSLPTGSSKLVPITIKPSDGASIISVKVFSDRQAIADVTADGNKLGGDYWSFEVWPKSMGETPIALVATDSNGLRSIAVVRYTVFDKPQVTTNLASSRINLSGSASRRCTVVGYEFMLSVTSLNDVPMVSTSTSDSLVGSLSMSKINDNGSTQTYKVSGSSVKAGTTNLNFTFTNAYGTTTKTVGVTRTC